MSLPSSAVRGLFIEAASSPILLGFSGNADGGITPTLKLFGSPLLFSSFDK